MSWQKIRAQASRYLIGALIALALDAVVMFALLAAGLPVVIARLLALLTGVTTTYFFNRAYTFNPAQPASFANWAKYLGAQSIGAALNFGLSTLGIFLLGRDFWAIAVSVCIGAGVGFCYNFFAARRLLDGQSTKGRSNG